MGRSLRSTIIVVTYNHRRDVALCLATLLPTIGPDDEVVVVDNASTDGTPEFVRRMFPTVRLVANCDNRGFGAACNQAGKDAQGDHLVFLNPDTQPLPGWLDALLDALGSVPGAGLATPKILLRASPEVIDTFGHDVHVSGIVTCRGWGQSARSYANLEQVAAVSGACFALRHDLFARLGGFDERLFLYYEDDDLSLRARLAGFTCIAVPASRVLHDHTPGFAADKLRYLERNRLWTTLKVYRWSTLFGLAPVIAVAELLGWGMALALGPRHIGAKWQAYRDMIQWLPSLTAARRQVEHVVSDRAILRDHRPRLAFAQVATGPFADTAECVTSAAFEMLAPR